MVRAGVAVRRCDCPSADRSRRCCPSHSIRSLRAALRSPSAVRTRMPTLHPSSAWLFSPLREWPWRRTAAACDSLRTATGGCLSLSFHSSAPPLRSARCPPTDQQAAARSAARSGTRCRIHLHGRRSSNSPLAADLPHAGMRGWAAALRRPAPRPYRLSRRGRSGSSLRLRSSAIQCGGACPHFIAHATAIGSRQCRSRGLQFVTAAVTGRATVRVRPLHHLPWPLSLGPSLSPCSAATSAAETAAQRSELSRGSLASTPASFPRLMGRRSIPFGRRTHRARGKWIDGRLHELARWTNSDCCGHHLGRRGCRVGRMLWMGRQTAVTTRLAQEISS